MQNLEDLANRRSVITSKVRNSFHVREIMLRRKSRHKWIVGGDPNSKFFHKALKSKFMRKNVMGILTSRGWVEHVEEVKEEVFHHFDSRFQESNYRRPSLAGISFEQLLEDGSF